MLKMVKNGKKEELETYFSIVSLYKRNKLVYSRP